MFFEKFSIIKLIKEMSKKKKKLLKSSRLLFYLPNVTPLCPVHQGMERTSSIIPILELEKLERSKVLLKILFPNFFLKNIKATGQLKV